MQQYEIIWRRASRRQIIYFCRFLSKELDAICSTFCLRALRNWCMNFWNNIFEFCEFDQILESDLTLNHNTAFFEINYLVVATYG